MMKQNSILNYFQRTPKSSPSTSTIPEKNVDPGKKTPPSVDNKDKSITTTPVSSRISESKRKSVGLESAKKRPRPTDTSPTKEFSSGAVVWAKLEGYPWWPAMIRGEQQGSVCHRSNRSEYHVQFFDRPPSRAWIRKSDIKSFKGSTDGAVPPAKTDPNWLDGCKYADGVLSLSPKKRLEKYWVDFPELEVDAEESEEEVKISPNSQPKKRRRIQDGDKDDEYKCSGSSSSETEDESEVEEVLESDEASEPSPSPDVEFKKIPKRQSKLGSKSLVSPAPTSTPKRKTLITKTLSSVKNNTPYRLSPLGTSCGSPSLSSPAAAKSASTEDSGPKWVHLGFEWLYPENIMDARRNRPDHPDYDPKTLYIPLTFKEKCTPAVRQWWEMKQNHFDTILFFKIGKFYELYHMDAVIAVQELNIDFMRGEFAHCGFPEIAYSKFAAVLVEKGYKVARVEQTETPEMMNERCRKMAKASKYDRVVKRELCQVTTKGVRTATFQDQSNESSYRSDSTYLYAVTEKPVAAGVSEVGVCFVDTTIGKFHIGQFQDDRHFSRLRTVFAHFTPVEILYEKNRIPPGIQNLFSIMSAVKKECLVPEKEFWSDKTTLKNLSDGKYFWNDILERNEFPDSIKQFLSNDDRLCLTAAQGSELGVKALGAVIWYLKKCLIEFDLLSMKEFHVYFPADETQSSSSCHKKLSQSSPKFMILDGVTLRNLNINSGAGNLLSKIDFTSTAFGKRLLRHWVCVPLAIPEEINARLDVVEELMGHSDLISTIIPILRSLPDLERLISKVHTLGSAHRGKLHPDSRAFFFEETKYSRRKVADLLSVLKGFKLCVKIIDAFKNPDLDLNSKLLTKLICDFPKLDGLLHFFDNSFDHQKAAKDGKIIPSEGVDIEYDSLCKWQEEIEFDTAAYLKEVGKKLGTKVVYFGSEKKRFQIEVQDKVSVPHSYELTSSRKGFKRYHTKETKEFLERTLKMEANREIILKDLMRRVFEKIDSHRDTWKQAICTIASIDVLLSLTRYALSQDNMCRPKVVSSENPFINVEDGRHPCVPTESYIPNSAKLGSSESDAYVGTFTLLTGPNMGGKSTLMRQMGLLTVLAQVGSFVPATTCELSVVDRIFTRVGASDNINEGQSTFFVEMSETSAILKHATQSSLVLIDELGRGTATFDGTAIACAVAQNLMNLGCRTYFSTHYHYLVPALSHFSSIQLGHMACMVENENEDDPTQETITFLYKLIPGACPKSYGFNAARLAGLPTDIIRVAHKKAKEMEKQNNNVDLFRKLVGKRLTLKEARASLT
ncbi:unnamed protein product [Allacma fusca]|uniref:DNA mismatch repair protein n=1 Tax=Allacma fusca TaxID=39272 RepID=A0A8J2NU94_9HEXA|nr:unnamed protein product [Allacma fusca]